MTSYTNAQKLDFLRLLYAGRRDQAEQMRAAKRPAHDIERVEAQLPIIQAIAEDYKRDYSRAFMQRVLASPATARS